MHFTRDRPGSSPPPNSGETGVIRLRMPTTLSWIMWITETLLLGIAVYCVSTRATGPQHLANMASHRSFEWGYGNIIGRCQKNIKKVEVSMDDDHHHHHLIGGLEHYIFPYIGNNHSNWLSYFSEGSKPPTSHHNHHHRHPPYPDFHPPTPPYQYPHPQIWSCSASTGHLGDDFPPPNCYRIPTVPGGKVVPPQWHVGWFMFVGLCYPHVHSLEFFLKTYTRSIHKHP